MHTKKVRRLIIIPLICGFLSACSGSDTSATTVTTHGARTAIDALFLVTGEAAPMHAPSAPFGIFISMYLAGRGAIPVNAALEGIDAHMKIATNNIPLDETYSLLETFGTVLQVDVADMLNRSQNRAETLNQYMSALGNVTTRSKQRSEEIQQELGGLKATLREQSGQVSDIQRTISTALRAKDYATAGENQKALNDAQAKETETQNRQKQLLDLQKTFNQLLDIAAKRIDAIEKNREVLVAGLKVVDVPGAEDLGVLQGTKKSSRYNFGY